MTSTCPAGSGSSAVAGAPATDRIVSLDLVRGIAVLGILVMNAVSYGLGTSAYFNLSAGGIGSSLDWGIGGLGEVFVDQKFMALFSMLFGAGVPLFADAALAKGSRPVLLSLWRNTLLLGIGLVHAWVWDGDVLVVYALSAPFVIALRNMRPGVLLAAGASFVLLPALLAVGTQGSLDAAGTGLGEYWLGEGAISDSVGAFLLVDFFSRALGMMLIGVGLYRTGIITGARSQRFYRRMAVIGLGIGVPLSALGLIYVVAHGFSVEVALIGSVPNTLATVPFAIGYVGLFLLWADGRSGPWILKLRAVGRMALTNYLAQTALGILVLGTLAGSAELTRSWIALFTVSVWGLQLAWSQAWLTRFRYGPVEWLWRCATYGTLYPLRR